MESDRWPQIYAGIRQHMQKIYNGKKAALKERYWVPEEDGSYDLERIRRGHILFKRYLRRQIDDHILPSLDSKTTWDKSLPRKVFLWRLKLDRLPPRLNLSSKGIEIPEITCHSCSGNAKSNHLFSLAVNLLRRLGRLFGGGMKTLFLFSIPTPIGSIP
nr:RNA-directed DNA polymerase, eukaryota, reverse transcriptase zinc-binding domain protein [Tanacetum cinerariifolium]